MAESDRQEAAGRRSCRCTLKGPALSPRPARASGRPADLSEAARRPPLARPLHRKLRVRAGSEPESEVAFSSNSMIAPGPGIAEWQRHWHLSPRGPRPSPAPRAGGCLQVGGRLARPDSGPESRVSSPGPTDSDSRGFKFGGPAPADSDWAPQGRRPPGSDAGSMRAGTHAGPKPPQGQSGPICLDSLAT